MFLSVLTSHPFLDCVINLSSATGTFFVWILPFKAVFLPDLPIVAFGKLFAKAVSSLGDFLPSHAFTCEDRFVRCFYVCLFLNFLGCHSSDCYLTVQLDFLSFCYWWCKPSAPHPHPHPICTFLLAGFTQGTWSQFPIMPLASPLGLQPCWVWKPIPPHVTCSRSPAGKVRFMPPHCCGFLTPKDFSSVISSLALYQLKNVLSSTFKFSELEEGGIGARAF